MTKNEIEVLREMIAREKQALVSDTKDKTIMDEKQALARIAKLCRENIEAFGKNYQPKWRGGGLMPGAKAEGAGVAQFAQEVLTEIKSMRREMNRKRKA